MAGKIKAGFVLTLWLLSVPAYFSAAQDPKVSIEPRPKKQTAERAEKTKAPNIRVETALVAVNITVVDPLNRLVTGLEKKNFRVFEDKVEQEIAHLSSEDAPVSVGLVFDVSGSMGGKLQKSRQAVAQFLKLANPEDEFFLIQFSDRPELAINFTRDASAIQNGLIFTQSKGYTALLDAIYLAMNQMKKAHNLRKALLIVSDGGDNSSRYTPSEVKGIVREADVQIFAIGIYEPLSVRARTPEELAGPELLTTVAEYTGGRQFSVENLNELPDIAVKIGVELRNEYVAYYYPKNKTKNGKYRRIQVKLVPPKGLPDLKAYSRTGYYAPFE